MYNISLFSSSLQEDNTGDVAYTSAEEPPSVQDIMREKEEFLQYYRTHIHSNRQSNSNINGDMGSSSDSFSLSHNAVVVDTASPHVLAEAVQMLANFPLLRQALGMHGRQSILEHFSVERQMNQYSQLYRSLI